MGKAEKIAAIVGITQVFKYYGVPTKFCPVLAMLLGAAFEYSEDPNAQSIISGVVLGGLTAGGYGVIKGASQSVLSIKKTPANIQEFDDDRCT